MSVDVIIVTFKGTNIMKSVLKSIKKNVPYHRLIVIVNEAGKENQQFLSLLDEHNTEVHFENVGRQYARQMAIDMVDCPFLMFVDDDCVLSDQWFEKAFRYMKKDVGAVEGFELHVHPLYRAFEEGKLHLRKLLKMPELPMVRAFTGDTLIRKEAIKGIRLSMERFLTDQYFKDYIEERGYKWVKTMDCFCHHYMFKPVQHVQTFGEDTYRYGVLSLKVAIRNFITAPFRAFYIFVATKNPKVVPFILKFYYYYLKGCLRGYMKGRHVLNDT